MAYCGSFGNGMPKPQLLKSTCLKKYKKPRRCVAVRSEYRCCRAEIDLCLLAGHAFHPAKRYRAILSRASDKSADNIVAALKSVLVSEVLVNSLTGQPALQFGFNDLAERFTLTATGRCITGICLA